MELIVRSREEDMMVIPKSYPFFPLPSNLFGDDRATGPKQNTAATCFNNSNPLKNPTHLDNVWNTSDIDKSNLDDIPTNNIIVAENVQDVQ